MKISKNDPRLTAYVLNELDALEKSMIENAIKTDTELQNEVNEIKKSVAVFNTLAHAQEEIALSPKQRDQLFAKPAATTAPAWSWWTIGGSLATASLAVILFQQKAHETKIQYAADIPAAVEYIAPAPQKAALAKKQEAKAEAPALAANNFAAEKSAESQPIAQEERKEAEPAKNSEIAGIGSASGAGAGIGTSLGALADQRAGAKAKSAVSQNQVAMPMAVARMAKDDAAPASPPPPAESRARRQEIPLELNVALSQFLPTETEPADVEISMNLTQELKKCFVANFSKYVRYNAKFRLNWTMQKMKPINVLVSDIEATGLITPEIRSCVTQGFESQNWTEVKYIKQSLKPLQFEAVLSIVSE